MVKRFIVDSMLGKLAKWLRILGFDARSRHISSQRQVSEWMTEGFIVVTRNRRWGSQHPVVQLDTDDPMEQLQQVIRICGIRRDEATPLGRCILCNELLDLISREEALGKVPDFIYETHVRFHRCPCCRKIYWYGSHPRRIMDRLEHETGWSI